MPLTCTLTAWSLRSPTVGPGQSPGGGSGGKAPESFRTLALKMTYFRAK